MTKKEEMKAAGLPPICVSCNTLQLNGTIPCFCKLDSAGKCRSCR